MTRIVTGRFGSILATSTTLLLSAVACADPVRTTSDNYVGTWSRGNDKAVSIVAIAKVGDAYRFRWSKRSFLPDGTVKLRVKCDWDGRCLETLDGVEQATYTFRTWLDFETRHLMVEGRELRTVPERIEIHYIDELLVEDGGRTLRSVTHERDGHVFEPRGSGPTRSFSKVSDGIAYPPR